MKKSQQMFSNKSLKNLQLQLNATFVKEGKNGSQLQKLKIPNEAVLLKKRYHDALKTSNPGGLTKLNENSSVGRLENTSDVMKITSYFPSTPGSNMKSIAKNRGKLLFGTPEFPSRNKFFSDTRYPMNSSNEPINTRAVCE